MNDLVTNTEPDALYELYYRCSDACQDPGDPYGQSPDHRCYSTTTYSITKVTATRIYFCDRYGRKYCLARTAFDEDGRAFHRGLRKSLYLTEPEIPRGRKPASVSDLRRQMADAHPDRGGDRDTFMAARARYVSAKRRSA